MARKNLYVTIEKDKRSRPFKYRIKIVKVLPDGKRKTEYFPKVFSGANASTYANEEKARLQTELLKGNIGVSSKNQTILQYLDYYLKTESHKKKWSTKHLKGYSLYKDELLNYCDLNRLKYLSDIKLNHLKSFLADLPKDYKIRTVNARIVFLKSVFKNGVEDDLIYYDPTVKLKKLKEADKKNTKPLTNSHVQTILKFLDTKYQWFKSIFMVAIYSGMRRGELSKLMWDMVDFNNNFIKIPYNITKGKYERIIPLHDEIKKILIKMKIENSDKYNDDHVFRNNEGRPVRADHLTHLFSKIKKNKELNLPQEIKFHSTRATFITKAMQTGHTVATQAIVGHKDLSTTSGYIEPFHDEKIKIIESINYNV